jgi:hypothetical protein
MLGTVGDAGQDRAAAVALGLGVLLVALGALRLVLLGLVLLGESLILGLGLGGYPFIARGDLREIPGCRRVLLRLSAIRVGLAAAMSCCSLALIAFARPSQ